MSTRSAGGAAFDRALLKTSFTKVPLGLKLLDHPLDAQSPLIFQMSLQKSRRFGEYFQIWPGHTDNEMEVLSVDHSFLQLVLRVQEPRRSYIVTERKSPYGSDQAWIERRLKRDGGRIVSETRYVRRIEYWTPAIDRRYLCGRDDVHLFIAQVPAGDTVAEAHESLKPEEVRQAEARQPGGVQRQGEWFFVPLRPEEADRLELHRKTWPRAVKLNVGVGPGRNPHVAEMVVTIDRRTRTGHREFRQREVYARGVVVHADHREVRLGDWSRVYRNREVDGGGEKERVKWID
jgi:hypothetical protein